MRLALPYLTLVAVLGADPLPADRTPGGRGTWNGLVGIPGGIPHRTTIFTNFTASVSTASLQAAINVCPSNQVIKLAAGTYSLGFVKIVRDGVTLRGSTNVVGQPTTIITCSSHFTIGDDNTWYTEYETPVVGNHRNWTAGYTQGATNITISSVTGLSVGQLIILDQLNDQDMTAYSPVNPDGPYVTGEYTSVAFPLQGHDRVQFQINRIYAISGTDIMLTEPLYMPNWNTGGTNSPQLWFFANPTLTQMSGIEDIAIATDGGEGCIYMQYTYACWTRNIDASEGTTAHVGYIFPLLSLRPEIRHCYLHDTGVADRYGIHTRIVSGLLCEDNAINSCSTMLMVNGVSGSVYSYNYSTNLQGGQSGGFMVQGTLTHGGSPNMNLFEGNWSPQLGLDSQWQNSAYMASLRCRYVGKDDGNTAAGNIQAVAIHYTNRHASVIGSVLGKTGVHTIYEVSGTGSHPASCGDGARIYYLGYEAGGDAGCNGIFDTVTTNTLLRAVNWTAATSTNSGIVLDGYTANDIPASYYLTARPASFGAMPWPPIDVGNITYSDIHTNLPAAFRLATGLDTPQSAMSSAFQSALSGRASLSGKARIQ